GPWHRGFWRASAPCSLLARVPPASLHLPSLAAGLHAPDTRRPFHLRGPRTGFRILPPGFLSPPLPPHHMDVCGNPPGRKAGIISRIRLENFMCHSCLQIEFGDWVNFITGQNGSRSSPQSPFFLKKISVCLFPLFIPRLTVGVAGGKSAILTALCVAFGCRARDTQRASQLKDFIKTGCRADLLQLIRGCGKSAILTALCVAFGCRARDTQRASQLKDFIKTGCSYATVIVEIKNQGEDAFKPNIYGDLIMVERRITESASSTILKDCLGLSLVSSFEIR
ncbi:hypothetical protein Taro_035939, partial [Colocasia esculenta]|nr:hypothetical protein [Colocasia esculenta]